jgi:hypothetical protein
MAVSQNKVVTSQSLASGQAVCTLAKTTYNDAVGAVKIATAGPNGGVLYSLKAEPRMTVTVTQLQAYRSSDGGVTLSLFNLVTMAAYTMAATTAPGITDFGYSETAPLRLAPNEQIWVATGVAFTTGIEFDATWENL